MEYKTLGNAGQRQIVLRVDLAGITSTDAVGKFVATVCLNRAIVAGITEVPLATAGHRMAKLRARCEGNEV